MPSACSDGAVDESREVVGAEPARASQRIPLHRPSLARGLERPRRYDRRVTRLTGFVPPIATPFRDGALDLESLGRLLDHLAEHVAGYLVGGSVGEVPSLTLEERAALMRAAAGRRPAGHSLAVSISDNAIANSRVLSDVAGEVGADVLMLSCPNYFANDLPMLIEYFGAVGAFASAEICLYDNPLASHTLLSVADIKAIADAVPRVTHIKVTDTAIDKVAALREATDLVICAGDDAVLWNQFARGVDGAMVALPMIAPEIAASMWDATRAVRWTTPSLPTPERRRSCTARSALPITSP